MTPQQHTAVSERGEKRKKQHVRVNCIPIKENTAFDTLELMRTELTWTDPEGNPVDHHRLSLYLL